MANKNSTAAFVVVFICIIVFATGLTGYLSMRYWERQKSQDNEARPKTEVVKKARIKPTSESFLKAEKAMKDYFLDLLTIREKPEFDIAIGLQRSTNDMSKELLKFSSPSKGEGEAKCPNDLHQLYKFMFTIVPEYTADPFLLTIDGKKILAADDYNTELLLDPKSTWMLHKLSYYDNLPDKEERYKEITESFESLRNDLNDSPLWERMLKNVAKMIKPLKIWNAEDESQHPNTGDLGSESSASNEKAVGTEQPEKDESRIATKEVVTENVDDAKKEEPKGKKAEKLEPKAEHIKKDEPKGKQAQTKKGTKKQTKADKK